MPRNTSGAYTLPTGNPVVPDTIIQSVWANDTMADLAAAMTDSLDRNGRGTMLDQLLLFPGSVTEPSIAFGAESSTGMYRGTAGVLSLAVLGQDIAQFTSTNIHLLRATQFDGAATFTGDTNITGALKVTKLGIGVDAAAPLHVKGSGVLAVLETTAARGSGAAYMELRDPAGVKGFFGYSAPDNDTLYLYNLLNAEMVFGTNSQLSMVLNRDGNTALGHGAPLSRLDVAGTITLRGNIAGPSTAHAYTIGADPDLVHGGAIQLYGSTSGRPNLITFRTAGAEVGGFNETGSLFLGKPLSLAQGDGFGGLYGAGPASDLFTVDTNKVLHAYGLAWKTFSDAPFGVAALSGYSGVRFYSNSKEQMRVGAEGGIGIGATNTAQGKLTVSESAYIGAVTLCGTAEPARYGARLINDTANGQAFLAFAVNTNSSGFLERMRVQGDGNVGIGQGAATRRLEINGTAYGANNLGGLRVTAANVPSVISEFLVGMDPSGIPYTSVRTGNDGNAFINFFTGSGPTERVRIAPTGTWLISNEGAYPPSTFPLSIENQSGFAQSAIRFTNNGVEKGRIRSDYNGNLSLVAMASGFLDFYTAGDSGVGASRLRIDGSGNVMLGQSGANLVYFNSRSESANGHIALPWGIRLQWGAFTKATAGTVSGVTFPTPFPTACWTVQVTDSGSGGWVQRASSVSKTGFTNSVDTWNSGANPSNVTIYWFAIGI